MQNNIDEIRENALNEIEKNERNYKSAFVGAAAVEVFFLAGFLLLMDFSNRGHLLLLLASVAIYTILIFGLLALGLHHNRNTLQILQAIQISKED